MVEIQFIEVIKNIHTKQSQKKIIFEGYILKFVPIGWRERKDAANTNSFPGKSNIKL